MRITTRDGILVVGVYSPSSSGARLRGTYDGITSNYVKKIFFYGATILLWTKLRTRFKLSWQDARKRVSDLLDTPIVRYLSTECYEKITAQAGLKTVGRRKISNMTILYLEKAPDAT